VFLVGLILLSVPAYYVGLFLFSVVSNTISLWIGDFLLNNKDSFGGTVVSDIIWVSILTVIVSFAASYICVWGGWILTWKWYLGRQRRKLSN
jgi:uncharacterized membrane protein YvlD (DUF360 family)